MVVEQMQGKRSELALKIRELLVSPFAFKEGGGLGPLSLKTM